MFNQQLALEIVGQGQESEAWARKLATWKSSTAQAATMADTLRGVAVSQIGQGFGNVSNDRCDLFELSGRKLISLSSIRPWLITV